MTNLREVNIDSNVVGWYQTGFFGSFLTESLIESQATYQSQIPNSIMIIYGLSFFPKREKKNFFL
jgi:translation initiation factor 3 subunit H